MGAARSAPTLAGAERGRAGTEPVTTMLLRGGLVADGIGATTRRADVLIDGQSIASVGAVSAVPPGCDVIDVASGSVICPGFIDAHAHAEGPLLAAGRVDGALAQGVTTLVTGQDGQSWIGATADTARYLNRYFGAVNGALEPARDLSVAAYGEALAGKLSQNVAVLASQGTIRHNIAGLAARPLDAAERAEARRQLESALADGAVGLSSGLDYLPSRFGDIDELADIAGPLAAAGRPYVSHLRGYGPDVRAGLGELVAVGLAAGIRVHASHLWGGQADVQAAFADASAAGVAISYDMYPYRKSSTILAMLLLPPGLQARGPDQTLAALADPGQRAVLLADEKFSDEYLAGLTLGCLPAGLAGLAGQTITQAAARTSKPAGERASGRAASRAVSGASSREGDRAGGWVLDLLARADLGVGAHLDRPAPPTDEDLAWLVTDDRHCAGSDAIYQGQHPHPRGHGAFARLAAHYLSDGPATGYQRLARHLAAGAADVYGLGDRGRLAPGMAADIAIIGPAGIAENATYDAPLQNATGVSLVIVNGAITWRDGQPVTANFPGRLVS